MPLEDEEFLDDSVIAYIWIAFSFIIIIICITKTVVRYMMHNVSIFFIKLLITSIKASAKTRACSRRAPHA